MACDNNNITYRNKLHRTSSLTNLSKLNDLSNSHIFDSTMTSLPSTSLDENRPCCEALQEQINRLTCELQSANSEIDILNEENQKLKLELSKCYKTINLYKTLNSNEYSPKTSNRKNKRNTIHDNNRQVARLQFLTPERNNRPIEELTSAQLVMSGESLQNEDSSPIDNTTSSVTKQSNADLLKKDDKKVITSSPKKRVQTPKITNNKNKNCASTPLLMSNLCIISSETSNRLYTICQKTSLSNCNICHYRMPNCSIRQLLDNLDKKVQNFTHSDYCVIYVGEDDFKKTQNYIELVIFIRNKLQPLTHTNFIVCLPTFKYMTNKNVLFNSRVDTFNNLMFMDVKTHKYAYLLDSNLNLPYTFDTYNQQYGSLNNKGLNIVITDLQDLVTDLNSANALSNTDCPQITDTQLHENSQFFL